MNNQLQLSLAGIVKSVAPNLEFTFIEVGALPVDGAKEPFHELLDDFPGSRVLAFEIDSRVCEDLNRKTRKDISFYPIALGLANETRNLYNTKHPMCTSLYEPNEVHNNLYNNLEVANLANTETIKTISLDHFTREYKISRVDFIKIDIQGAELEVFQGGKSTLEDVVAIVTEVEFVRLYKQQPLFGDICVFLSEQGFYFHKFLGLAGRSLRPTIINNNPNFATQHLWSDAIFIRNIENMNDLSDEGLLKLSVLTFIYNSPDVAVYCLQHYDKRHGTTLGQELLTTSGG